jgi:hypothetical protein
VRLHPRRCSRRRETRGILYAIDSGWFEVNLLKSGRRELASVFAFFHGDSVLREAFRVLKPGGRFVVSDLVTRGEILPEIRQSVLLWVGRVAGAQGWLECVGAGVDAALLASVWIAELPLLLRCGELVYCGGALVGEPAVVFVAGLRVAALSISLRD